MSTISLRGASANNLVKLDLDLEVGGWTAVTGVSGSGKSTLVFDVLVREGRRRFLASWSSRARRLLGKLGDADADGLSGLPVPIALGASRTHRSERSTVGTLTGLLDLLRLVFARDATGGPHRRADFSFNSTGACEACSGVGLQDLVAADLLVADPTRSIRGGALRPTLKSGYTVYSQVTVDVMDQLCRAHGFTVDTPWQELSDEQRHMVFYGTTAITVPFGKHSIASRLKWEGITAKPREEGHYRGLIPVIAETLKRSRNPNILKYARSVPCEVCEGTRLAELGRSARVGDATLPSLCSLPLSALPLALSALGDGPAASAVRPLLLRRAALACELGLGHLSLDRRSTTLSDGELQRVQLIRQLGLALSGLLLALDEPTLGLHPAQHAALATALRGLQAQGNTLLVVEHSPAFATAADRVLTLGPGRGSQGGRLTGDVSGSTAPLGPPQPPRRPTASPVGPELVVRGASLHNLHTDATFAHGALNVVIGESGSGKSSLVLGTLAPALRGDRAECTGITGGDGWAVAVVDARPIGRTPRSTPATATGLFDTIRKAYAAQPDATSQGLTASHFSHNHAKGRCETCEGLGVERVGLHLLADVELPCPACAGGRYRPEVLTVRWLGLTVAELLQSTVSEVLPLTQAHPDVHRRLEALEQLGLGSLQLGRSTTTLSRGEAQRIKLARLLGQAKVTKTVVLLDEPDRGLHPDDLARLIAGLRGLVSQGHTVVAISHHPVLWAHADRLVELREGAATSLQEPPEVVALPSFPRVPPPEVIGLSGVRTNNLKALDVRFAHRALTAVVGVSGSGKSSLVFDTLAAEAQRRFAETLPFEARRALQHSSRPLLDSATGLTPTLSLRQERPRVDPATTVAALLGVSEPLRLLWSRRGEHHGRRTSLRAEQFSPNHPLGACAACAGVGTVRRCSPTKLVTHPTLSLLDGALAGTPGGRFFTGADDKFFALLGAAIGKQALSTPWDALTQAQRDIALNGAGPEPLRVTWRFKRGARTGEHPLSEPWRGFVALVEEEAPRRAERKNGAAWWDAFSTTPCPTCRGDRLNEAAREVVVGNCTLPQLLRRSAAEVVAWLDTLSADPVAHALASRVAPVLHMLRSLDLGALPLGQAAATLSASEHQCVRLVALLITDLSQVTFALDEPTAGLHPAAALAVVQQLRALVDRGNTVVVVTHDPVLLAAADHQLQLGPGAGADGGQQVPVDPTPAYAPSKPSPPVTAEQAQLLLQAQTLVLTGDQRRVEAFAHKLPSALPRTTPDPSRGGATVLTRLNLASTLQAALHAANPTVPTRAFSPNSPAGRCKSCKGTGHTRVALDILADLERPCADCAGSGFRPELRATTLAGLALPELLKHPLDSLHKALSGRRFARALAVVSRLKLGHLALGTRARDLSGGERRRLALAGALLAADGPTRFVLVRPHEGLHPRDISAVAAAVEAWREQGHQFVVISSEWPTGAHRTTATVASEAAPRR